jgi:Tfp pilus assembly protein PilX
MISLNGEKGSALLFALMIMVILSMIGFYTMDDAVMESKISRNNYDYKNNLYIAESSAREAIQRMASEPNVEQLLPNDPNAWVLNGAGVTLENIDWVNDGIPSLSTRINGQTVAWYIVYYDGVAQGEDMTGSSTKYDFTVYSRTTGEDGEDDIVLELGYFKRITVEN